MGRLACEFCGSKIGVHACHSCGSTICSECAGVSSGGKVLCRDCASLGLMEQEEELEETGETE